VAAAHYWNNQDDNFHSRDVLQMPLEYPFIFV
jgi:hypothetical protein